MNRKIILGVLILLSSVASAQYNDLIVTTEGDSIACSILEVNDSMIVYKMKIANQSMQKGEQLKNILKFDFNVIPKGIYQFKPGTSYIEKWFPEEYPVNSKTYSVENLENSSSQELEYYRYKALKKQTNGKTIRTIGLGSIVAGAGLVVMGQNESGWKGIGTMGIGAVLAGSGLITTFIGISVKSTGKSRVSRIDSLDKSAFKIEMNPYINSDEVFNSYQTGIRLRVSF